MLRVFHCADIHLDSPFSLLNQRQAERRRNQLRGAFTSALLFAREQKTDIFIISGDLFDGEYVTADTRDFLASELKKLGMPVFISPGNHDHLGVSSAYKKIDFPENVHVFGEKREVVHLPELGADIYGFGFTSKNYLSSPVANWKIENPDRINILVCHGDLALVNSETGPIRKEEIASSGFDYIALGHIHKPSGLCKEGDTYYAYPGCIEGRSFDETGVKGALFGRIEKGSVDMKQYPFSKSRYEIAEVDVSGTAEKSEILDRIRASIRQYTDDTYLRLILKGEMKKSHLILESEIGKGCEYPASVEIVNKTTVAVNLTELESQNTLKGVFCRRLRAMMEQCEEGSEDYRVLSLALKYGLAALDDRNVVDYIGGDEQ